MSSREINELKDNLLDTYTIENKDYLTSNLLYFDSKEKNPQLKELIFQLKKYKKEVERSIDEKHQIKDESFKKVLYHSLESLLYQMANIASSTSREEIINSIYKWFQEKTGLYFSSDNNKDFKDKIELKTSKSQHSNIDQLIKDQREIIKTSIFNNSLSTSLFSTTRPIITTNDIIKNEKFNENSDKRDLIKSPNTKEDIDSLRETKRNSSVLNNPRESSKETFYSSLEPSRSKYISSTILLRKETDEDLNKNESNGIQPNITIKEDKMNQKNLNSVIKSHFKYNILKLDKELEKQRNKAIINRRTMGEMSNLVHNFGVLRSQYKSNMVNKYEKKILKQDYKHILQIMKKEKKSNLFLTSQINATEKFNNQTRNYSRNNNHLTINNDNSLNQKEKELTLKRHYEDKDYSYIRNDMSINASWNKSNLYSKVLTDKTRNRQGGTIYSDFTGKTIEINTKLNPIQMKHKLFSIMKNNEEGNIPKDSYTQLFAHDPVFMTRASFKNTIDCKEIDNPKEQYYGIFNPLSPYHLENINSNNKKETENDLIVSHSIDRIKYAKRNFHLLDNNFLLLRKNMSDFKSAEFNSLRNHISKHRKYPKTTIMNAFINPSDEIHPIGFLPKNSSGLLKISN